MNYKVVDPSKYEGIPIPFKLGTHMNDALMHALTKYHCVECICVVVIACTISRIVLVSFTLITMIRDHDHSF
jgi:hypothetical protein